MTKINYEETRKHIHEIIIYNIEKLWAFVAVGFIAAILGLLFTYEGDWIGYLMSIALIAIVVAILLAMVFFINNHIEMRLLDALDKEEQREIESRKKVA